MQLADYMLGIISVAVQNCWDQLGGKTKRDDSRMIWVAPQRKCLESLMRLSWKWRHVNIHHSTVCSQQYHHKWLIMLQQFVFIYCSTVKVYRIIKRQCSRPVKRNSRPMGRAITGPQFLVNKHLSSKKFQYSQIFQKIYAVSACQNFQAINYRKRKGHEMAAGPKSPAPPTPPNGAISVRDNR